MLRPLQVHAIHYSTDTELIHRTVFMKFRVVSPEIAAKQAKKKEAAEKQKRVLAEKRAEKAKEKDSAPKQKCEKVEEASDNEHNKEGNQKTKNQKKEVSMIQLSDNI